MLWGILLIALFLGIWFYQRYFPGHFFSLRYRWIRFQVRQQYGRKRMQKLLAGRLLKKVYALAKAAVLHKNEALAYRVADLLKEAFGEAIYRKNESTKLMALILKALEEKQLSIAGYYLEAYQPLVRNLSQPALLQCLRQLIILLSFAQRRGQVYLVQRMIEASFAAIRRVRYTEPGAMAVVLKSLRRIGALALKNGDYTFYQEAKRQIAALPPKEQDEYAKSGFVQLLSSWLFMILKLDQKELLDDFCKFCYALSESGLIGPRELQRLILESPNISGMAVMNLHSKCGAPLIAFLLNAAALRLGDIKPAVRSAVALIQMAVAAYGLESSFRVVLPLLEKGREMLMHEIRFSKSTDVERRRRLLGLLHDIVFLFELIARTERVSVDVLFMRIQQCWIACSRLENSIPAVKRFCQGMLFYWMKKRKVLPEKLGIDGKRLFQSALFTHKERERLGF